MDERIRTQQITKSMQGLAWAYGIDDFSKRYPQVQHYIKELIAGPYAVETIEEACKSVRKVSIKYFPTLAEVESECAQLQDVGIGKASISRLRDQHKDMMVNLYVKISDKNKYHNTDIPCSPLIANDPDIYNQYLMDRRVACDNDFDKFDFIDTGKVVPKKRIET